MKHFFLTILLTPTGYQDSSEQNLGKQTGLKNRKNTDDLLYKIVSRAKQQGNRY